MASPSLYNLTTLTSLLINGYSCYFVVWFYELCGAFAIKISPKAVKFFLVPMITTLITAIANTFDFRSRCFGFECGSGE